MIRFNSVGVRAFLLIGLGMGLTLGAARMVANTVAGGLEIGCGGLVLAGALAALASRSISRPLNRLTEALRQNERNGFSAPEFPRDSPLWEVNRLAEGLNRAAHSIRRSRAELDDAYLQFVETMAQALDARDPYTAGHSIRVSAYSYAIARALGLAASENETIRIAAQLHDVGKIGIPDAVLQKTSALTPEEFGLIKLHPQIGRKILQKVARFEKHLDVIELNHENYDGTGYPYRLAGERIPFHARIVRVADAFDAMCTNRSYREARPLNEVIEELRSNSGTQFDPRIVAVFLELIANGKAMEILSEHSLVSSPWNAPVRTPVETESVAV